MTTELANPALYFRDSNQDGRIDRGGHHPYVTAAGKHQICRRNIISGVKLTERRGVRGCAVGAYPDDPDPVFDLRLVLKSHRDVGDRTLT